MHYDKESEMLHDALNKAALLDLFFLIPSGLLFAYLPSGTFFHEVVNLFIVLIFFVGCIAISQFVQRHWMNKKEKIH